MCRGFERGGHGPAIRLPPPRGGGAAGFGSPHRRKMLVIPRGADHDPTSRLTKVFGPKRALWRWGASRSVRDAVRKPW